jgi:hypothetical protein
VAVKGHESAVMIQNSCFDDLTGLIPNPNMPAYLPTICLLSTNVTRIPARTDAGCLLWAKTSVIETITAAAPTIVDKLQELGRPGERHCC